MSSSRPPIWSRITRWVAVSLKRRLVVSSAVFWIVAVTIIAFTFLGFGQQQMLNETRDRNVQTASIISRDLNSQMNGILADARNFTRHLELLSPDLDAQASAAISLRLSAPQQYRGIYLFDLQGRLQIFVNDSVDSLLRLRSADIITRSPAVVDERVMNAFRQSLAGGTYVSGVQYTDLGNVPVLHLGLSLSPVAGNPVIAVLEIDLQSMWERIDQITFGQTGFTYIVSREGTIIAYPESSHLGHPIENSLTPLLDGNEGFAEYHDPARGLILAAFSPVGGLTGWGVVIEQSASETNIPISRMGAAVIGIWMFMAFLGTAAIFRAVNGVTKPIVTLTVTTNDIARTGSLKRINPMKRSDEIGQLSRSFDQMIERLQATEGKLERAAIDERNRLARELHDAVSQTLFSASIIAEVLPKLWAKNPDEGRRRLAEIQQLTRGALAEMRTLLFELRPQALLEAETSYLLRQLVESFGNRHRIPLDLKIEDECSMDPEVKVAFYRIAQEALNNIAKHAQASQISIRLWCEGDSIRLSIADNGRGFDRAYARPGSLGLGIMTERSREIGAELSIESQPGQGTTVTVKWQKPVKEATNGGN
ncbi:Histidine kinase-, DNA gyrase B-, and HSP90-like ATPase [Dehalogenimonas formicexedens]|uniref:histidine kinase n=1 Tax=Dehalogenimonas formicexedens TaxID=1839801 RepID=A0A1P8F9W0_9CHLR|nr:histidine kinase [Dehalogenimonas formicexedens]APV45228.1 Histidine kinase-, DNA gyrase B-, and HSP90-like ATPase [Dehalogenimonas formicexedens]